MPFTTSEIAELYDRLARCYDWLEAPLELVWLARLRRQLLARARGRVLEVAVGSGKNLPYYPPDCHLTAVDASRGMLERARRRAQRLERPVEFLLADATSLPFATGTFDTVVSTLSTCTFPDPVAALREISRVCRPSGYLLLLEHGRSRYPRLARWQDRLAPRHYARTACRWNQDPLAIVGQAGLRVSWHVSAGFGIFHALQVEEPARSAR